MTSWPPIPKAAVSNAKVEALADQIQRETGHANDRERFHNFISRAAHSYSRSRDPRYPAADIENERKAVKVAHTALRNLRSALQNVVDLEWQYIHSEDRLSPPVSSPIRELSDAVDQLDGTKEVLDKYRKYLAKFRIRGRPKDQKWHDSIAYLAQAYREATGLPATTIFQRNTGDRSSGFVEFVASCLEIADSEWKRPAGFGNKVDNALKQLRNKNRDL